MIFRTAEQKADLKRSFERPDRPFFAAGACHVLAQAFLDSADSDDWNASLIAPHAGYRGMHVFVCSRYYAFDYHGYTSVHRFRDHYFNKMRHWFPGWSADCLELDISPISEEFCTHYGHRRMDQFYQCPFPRAAAYVQKFARPTDPDRSLPYNIFTASSDRLIDYHSI